MKKRFLAVLLCICVLSCIIGSATGSASQNNVLISKSYLEGTFLEQLKAMIFQRASDAEEALRSSYVKDVENLGQSYADKLKPDDPEVGEWLSAGDLRKQVGECDDTVVLAMGSGFVLSSGDVKLTDGVLIDLTVGTEISGGALVLGHRYVSAQETTLTVVSSVAEWLVEGQWKTTADGELSPQNRFDDVYASDWYYDSVCYVVERGLFQGTSDTKFEPLMTMNRAMLATVLYRMMGTPETTYSAIFTDVPKDEWYSIGIVWAAENGIVKGAGDGTYQPNGPLSREQIALMLYNYAAWLGLDTTPRSDLSTIPDGATVSAWASDAMSWAVAVGLFQGDQNGKLNPADSVTRSSVAVLLQRFELWKG